MKSFFNQRENHLADSLNGFSSAHSDIVRYVADGNFICRKILRRGKVAIVSGGGSGHEPLHCGFVGMGMLDAACPGHMFTSPTPDQISKAALATGLDAGGVFIVKNYAGDVMNFDLGAQMTNADFRQIIVSDDLATGREKSTRRGIAGTMIVQKLVGAAAEAGLPLDRVFAAGEKANNATRTLGVALNPSFNPITGHHSFQLEGDKFEFGVGIHGEPGIEKRDMKSAKDIALDICDKILIDMGSDQKKPALLFVNGLGATPLNELYLMYHIVRQIFEKAGVLIARSLVGNYVTSLNMTGCSVTLTSLDDELLRFWDAPVATPSLRWGS